MREGGSEWREGRTEERRSKQAEKQARARPGALTRRRASPMEYWHALSPLSSPLALNTAAFDSCERGRGGGGGGSVRARLSGETLARALSKPPFPLSSPPLALNTAFAFDSTRPSTERAGEGGSVRARGEGVVNRESGGGGEHARAR